MEGGSRTGPIENVPTAKRICIYGAGAVGTILGTWLARAGHDVSLIARGAQLEALRTVGAVVSTANEDLTASPRCTANPEELGPQDLVFITAKAPSLPGILPRLPPLLWAETVVLTVMNGLPWWMFQAPDASDDDRLQIDCLDPDGALSRSLPLERILGCVVNIGATMLRAGHVRQSPSHLLVVGEPDGRSTPRLEMVVDLLKRSGLNARATNKIRDAYWKKLLGNISFGPVSVLTGATNGQIGDDPGLHRLCRTIIDEVTKVGEKLGVPPDADPEERIRIGSLLRDHRTSMLQDFIAGRPLEIDAIVTAVIQLARHYGVAVPATTAVWALLRGRLKERDRT
ncbi:MAG: ketopantoate reductase family protein [Alphaproteobacteria bacterium]